MEVIAIRPGYYGERLIKEGERFEVKERATASWFTPVDVFQTVKVNRVGSKKEGSPAKTKSEGKEPP